MTQQQQRPVANIDISKLDKIACKECGGEVFCQGVRLFHLSALQSPTGKEGQVNVSAGHICAGCGAANSFVRIPAGKEKPFSVVAGGNGTLN